MSAHDHRPDLDALEAKHRAMFARAEESLRRIDAQLRQIDVDLEHLADCESRAEE